MSFDWDVIRTTTDKLANDLNGLDWDVHLIQYVGGRDWVIICRLKVDDPPGRPLFKGTATPNRTGGWLITIPSMGPNDEAITQTAKRAVDIERAAKLAISEAHGWAPEEFDVDIELL